MPLNILLWLMDTHGISLSWKENRIQWRVTGANGRGASDFFIETQPLFTVPSNCSFFCAAIGEEASKRGSVNSSFDYDHIRLAQDTGWYMNPNIWPELDKPFLDIILYTVYTWVTTYLSYKCYRVTFSSRLLPKKLFTEDLQKWRGSLNFTDSFWRRMINWTPSIIIFDEGAMWSGSQFFTTAP